MTQNSSATRAAGGAELTLSKSQADALRWLAAHNGTGVFGRDQVLVAGGERGPHMTITWLTLAAHRLVEYVYPKTGKMTGTRVTVTVVGHKWLRLNPEAPPTHRSRANAVRAHGPHDHTAGRVDHD